MNGRLLASVVVQRLGGLDRSVPHHRGCGGERRWIYPRFRRPTASPVRLAAVPSLVPRYNIAPTQPVAAVRLNPDRELVQLHWGLIPFGADDPKIGNRMMTARAETVATKPSFRNAFKKRRCLIVADGFYEWKKTGARKQPYFIHRRDDGPFAFAGLWERWDREGEAIESATIIVTEPNDLLEPIHDRMPVILSPDEYDLWLDPEFQDKGKLEEMLRPYRGGDLEAYPVSTVVNKPQNETEECVERVGETDRPSRRTGG